MRRKLPALCGTPGSIELKSPVTVLLIAQVFDSFRPHGNAVDIVAQIDLDPPLDGVDFHLDLHRHAFGQRRKRIVRARAGELGLKEACFIAWIIRRSE